MRQTELFTRTRKEAPSDEVAKNAELLIRAGFVHKEMAGVYSYLPLGFRVLEKIVQVIRQEMNAIGAQELIMTTLQDKKLWEKTDRWDDEKVDNWFKTAFKSGGETGLGITHEEPITQIMAEYVSSYRDLPRMAYQFQTKFRNELRAKSGIMRGKEFLMKDLYTFAQSEEEHNELYEKTKGAYKKIFSRVGIGERTHVTFASGGIFSEFSEEYQTLSEAGEDIIYVDEKSGIAVNKEVYSKKTLKTLGLKEEDLVEKKAIETANSFHLGTKFSEPIGLYFADASGQKKLVIMGSHGLGPTRLMGTIVEVLSDEKGIVWPEAIAPFAVHLISLPGGEEKADGLYRDLTNAGVEVFYDDRQTSAGEKFADADLMGMPTRVVVSEKSIAAGGAEVKKRTEKEAKIVPFAEAATMLSRAQ